MWKTYVCCIVMINSEFSHFTCVYNASVEWHATGETPTVWFINQCAFFSINRCECFLTYYRTHVQFYCKAIKAFPQLFHRPRCSLQNESSILEMRENHHHEGACFLISFVGWSIMLIIFRYFYCFERTIHRLWRGIYKVYSALILLIWHKTHARDPEFATSLYTLGENCTTIISKFKKKKVLK